MKTNINTTAIPESIATAIRAHHVSLVRLADQLDKAPLELAADILRAGLRAIDSSLGELGEVEFPLYLECTDATHALGAIANITDALDNATPEEFEALEVAGHGIPQVPLWKAARAEARRARKTLTA